MLTGISTQSEVLTFFTKWLEREYSNIDEDDELIYQLRIACADDLISDDVDYWANSSVKDLFRAVDLKLRGE